MHGSNMKIKSNNFHVLTAGEKRSNVTAIACINAAGQFQPSVLIFKGLNKKQEFHDG